MAENPETLEADFVSYDLEQPENREGAVVEDAPPKPAPKKKSGGRKRRRKSPATEQPEHSPTVAAETAAEASASAEPAASSEPSPSAEAEPAPKSNGANGAANGAVNGKAERPRKTVSLKGSLRNLLPNAESVKVYKDNMGKQSLVQTYKARDVATVGDIEEFIKIKLVPEYGGGDYQIDLVLPNGKVSHTLPLSFAEPPKKSDAEVIGQQLQFVQKELKEQREKNAEQSKSQPDPLEFLTRAKQLFKGDDGGMSAIILSMMQQMQGSRGDDAGLQRLEMVLEQMRRQLEESQRKKPANPQPMPNLAPEKDDSMKEFMQMLLQQQEQARKDAQERWERERREAEERRREERERYQREKEEAERREREKREDERRFWEAQRAADEKRHEMMMEMVRKGSEQQIQILQAQQEAERARFEAKMEKLTEAAQGPQTPQEVMAQAKEVVEFAETLGGSKRASKNADNLFGFLNNLIASSGNVSDAIQRVVDRIRVAEGGKPESSRQLPAGEASGQAPEPSAANDAPAGSSGLPTEYPIGFRDIMERANQSEEGRVKIESFLQSLKLLMDRGGEVWQADIKKLLMDALTGNKERALAGVENYLQHFLNQDVLNQETCEKIYELFDEHFEMIVAAIKNQEGGDQQAQQQ